MCPWVYGFEFNWPVRQASKGEGRARDDRYIHSLPVFIVFPLFLKKVRTLTKLFIVNKAIGCRELQLKTKTKSLVDK